MLLAKLQASALASKEIYAQHDGVMHGESGTTTIIFFVVHPDSQKVQTLLDHVNHIAIIMSILLDMARMALGRVQHMLLEELILPASRSPILAAIGWEARITWLAE